MIDILKLPPQIINDIAENMGIMGEPIPVIQEKIARLSPDEAFEKFCEWNGIIGWSRTLSKTLDKIREAAQ